MAQVFDLLLALRYMWLVLTLDVCQEISKRIGS
jgi:hypothetical protein